MKRITYFLSGALAALLISSATVSAFAAGGLITLNVQPAQVMVNGEVFQPKDAQGRDALVFHLQQHDLCTGFVRWLKHMV